MADAEQYTQADVDNELHACARYGELDDMRLMCEGDDTGPMVNYNCKDGGGSSALHKAAANGHVDVMEYLIAHGATFFENDSGATPLQWAVMNKQQSAVELLLKTFTTQIDVLKKPETGMSTLSTAYDTDCQEIITLLLAHDSAKALDAIAPEDTEERAEEMDETEDAASPSAENETADEAADKKDDGEELAKDVSDKLKL